MNNTGNQTIGSEISTLLVLRHNNNTVGMVQSVNAGGEVMATTPENKGSDAVMQIDASELSFADFYADFLSPA